MIGQPTNNRENIGGFRFTQKKVKALKKEQEEELSDAFGRVCSSIYGDVDANELRFLLRMQGFDIRKNEIDEISKPYQMDTGDNQDSQESQPHFKLNDFLDIMAIKLHEKEQNKEELIKPFSMLADLSEKQNQSLITVQSLKRVLKELGQDNLTDGEVQAMIETFGEHDNGKVSEQNFLDILKETNYLNQ